MDIIERKNHALDRLYMRHLSLEPLRDRIKIKEHCEAVLNNKKAKTFGDPALLDIGSIDGYLSNCHLPNSFRASYKDEDLTSWDKLIIAAKRFAVNYFQDKAKAINDSIERYKKVTKIILKRYNLDPLSLRREEGRAVFSEIIETELAVRLNWIIKHDKNHSVTSITPLVCLSKKSSAKKFFLNLLSAEREKIYSYAKSENRTSNTSIYTRSSEIPNKTVREKLSIYDTPSKRLSILRYISLMQYYHGTPDLKM